jgi:hypothetical protein
MEAYADTLLVGWHHQELDGDHLRALSVGVPLGYRYRRERVGPFYDRLGILHLPGLGAELDWELAGDLRLRARARFHADFAGVQAMNNADWSAAYPDEQGKAILRKQGYYYGWGSSAYGQVELSMGTFSLGGAAWAARYLSQEGLDRTQEDVTLDVSSEDSVTDLSAWLRIDELPGDAYLRVGWSRQDRDGRLGEFQASQRLDKATVQVGIER